MHRHSGTSEQTLENMEDLMRNHQSVLSENKIEEFLLNAGFALPVQFFQSLLIRGGTQGKNNDSKRKFRLVSTRAF